ncbi:MAG: PTS sugar transporter subunit IIA, partial [Spirochaetales bacterium]|nr:PTS sugar transporter subunit IIA [Spirochaetales bacterium]
DFRGLLMINDEILTLAETAEYLKVAEKTVQRMIAAHKIPCTRVGNQWRFIKSILDDWLMESMQEKEDSQSDLSRLMESGKVEVSLSRLILDAIIPLKMGSRREILSQLAAPLIDRDMIKNPEGYLNKLEDRENMISTAIGEGIAIPHIRNPRENDQAEPTIVVGISPEGLDFHAIDQKPVHLFFLVHTNSETVHLRILSRITGLLKNDGYQEFLSCRTKRDVESLLIKKETGSH